MAPVARIWPVIGGQLADRPVLSDRMKISVVVPAFNEAGRISSVLRAVVASTLVDDVIVVDDGSDDGTGEEAKLFPVRVVRLPENKGKAVALDYGISLAKNDTFLFLDADLVGLTTMHVDKLIRQYQELNLDMAVGVFANGRKNTDLAQKINPYASGQRVLTRKLWERAKQFVEVEEVDFGIEIALSRLAAKEDWVKEYIKLEGVTHVLKEEKRGFRRGMIDRLKMYGHMTKWLFKKLRIT
ncbi:MAG: glycosyltransferase [Candidatus Atribacteria bacterium]|nr:MAG: glycosyltransferase [Candidatus Atribacteria bacterium]